MVDISLPITFEIPTPMPRAYVFGRESSSGPLACMIHYRANKIEREAIAKAAAFCGVSASCFCREVINAMVQCVTHHSENKST